MIHLFFVLIFSFLLTKFTICFGKSGWIKHLSQVFTTFCLETRPIYENPVGYVVSCFWYFRPTAFGAQKGILWTCLLHFRKESGSCEWWLIPISTQEISSFTKEPTKSTYLCTLILNNCFWFEEFYHLTPATSNQPIIENLMTNDLTYQTYAVQISPASTISTTDCSHVDMCPNSSFPILHLATFHDPQLKIQWPKSLTAPRHCF